MEPWAYTYYFSADRLSDRFQDKPDIPGTTFRETKTRMEGPIPGKVLYIGQQVFLNKKGSFCMLCIFQKHDILRHK